MRVYKLRGSEETENIKHRISFLTKELNGAEKKEIYIGELRQKNMNYALVVFAGLFAFGLSFPTKIFSLAASLSLFLIMLVFCLLDRRYHKFIHGWRKTEKIIEKVISEVINNPKQDVEFPRYAEEGEREAEKFHLQPIIYYFLVLGGFFHLIYSIITYLRA